MSTIGSNALTLSDWARRVENEKIAKIVETLAERNEILKDMPFVEGNQPTGTITTVRSGMPSTTWRRLNYGVQPSKSRTVQVTDTCGMLEAYAEVDKDLADLNGNTAEFRFSEDVAFLESMNQEAASTTIYGNTESDPEKFMGLAPRYDSTSAENGGQIINGSGTGSDNTSVWVVCWSDQTIHGIFPKGKKTGLQHKDLGEVTLEDAAGGKYQGYRSHYKWELGMVLRDWRYVSRVANIDVSDLSADASTGANLIQCIIKAIHKIHNKNMGRMAIYCNETIETYLDLQTLSQSNTTVSYGKDIHGEEVLKFRGIPVRRVDAILNTEAKIS